MAAATAARTETDRIVIATVSVTVNVTVNVIVNVIRVPANVPRRVIAAAVTRTSSDREVKKPNVRQKIRNASTGRKSTMIVTLVIGAGMWVVTLCL